MEQDIQRHRSGTKKAPEQREVVGSCGCRSSNDDIAENRMWHTETSGSWVIGITLSGKGNNINFLC